MSFYNTAFLLSQFILLKSLFFIVLIIVIYICIKNSLVYTKKRKTLVSLSFILTNERFIFLFLCFIFKS